MAPEPGLILIVEDNKPSRDLMCYLLRAAGHSVLVCSDGATALDIATRERPALVVFDLQLDGMGGEEASRRMAADPSLRSIPRVAVTAFAMSGDRDRALASGFQHYISKPIEPTTFATEIQDVLVRAGRSAAEEG